MATISRLTLRRTEAPRRALKPLATPPTPIVKWAGGKSKLLDQLLVRRPMKYRRYYEPFLGGGAFFFKLAPRRAAISDLNSDLMNTYRCVAWNVEAVIQRLERHRKSHSPEYYYQTRERWNGQEFRADVDRAAAFIYMNKTCYNGLYRVNQRGHFNVPMGRYSAPNICDGEQLRAASRLLQRAEMRVGHFAERVADAGAGDFVYFDPPYDPLTRTASFTGYTADSFGDQDQHDLARVVADLTDRGTHVMISSSDTPFIRHLYRGFQLDQVLVNRAINSRASARGAVSELIITNGYL